MTAPFHVEQLAKAHDRKTFSCGVPPLDEYFRTQAAQDIKRLVANCFVLVETATGTVAGYYTLSATSIPLAEMPERLAKKLPRYPVVPAVVWADSPSRSTSAGEGSAQRSLPMLRRKPYVIAPRPSRSSLMRKTIRVPDSLSMRASCASKAIR